VTLPTTTEIAVLTIESKHQSDALQRIELKLDRVTNDHEQRLRLQEAGSIAMKIELSAVKTELADLKADLEPLQNADKRWAAVAIVMAAVVPVVLKVVWP
jgi:hypothetical protein